MEQKTNIRPNENPIMYVIFVLGFLSSITAYSVTSMVNEPMFIFKYPIVLGIICGFCSLKLGFWLVNLGQEKGLDIYSTS